MAVNSSSVPSVSQNLLAEKQVVLHSDKILIGFKSEEQFCRQCNTKWGDFEPPRPELGVAIHSSTLKRRFLDSCRKHYWWYGVLLSVLLIVTIVFPIKFRPHHPKGLTEGGTGIVVLDRGNNSTVVDIIIQHASGQIRHIAWDDANRTATGGTSDDTVLSSYAPQPRQGTPLMAVSYTIGNETTWRVFYIDTQNILQESVGSSTTDDFPNEWFPGPLGLGRFYANESPHTGLSVCQNMLWNPDSQGFNNGTLVLFYGAHDGTNHMLTHEVQNTAWREIHTFEDSSSDSGVECTCRHSPIVDVWMINLKGELLQSSFNFDLASNNGTAYSAGQWTAGVVYNQTVQNSTSISAIKFTGNSSVWPAGSTFIIFSSIDDNVEGVNVDTADRSHDPVVTQNQWQISSSPTVRGSKIAIVTMMTNTQNKLDSQEHGESLKIFMQNANCPDRISVQTGLFESDTFEQQQDDWLIIGT